MATTTPKVTTSTITIKLRNKLVKIHESRRHRKAIGYLKDHIARHFKSSPESIKISQRLNEYMEANNKNKFKPITISISKSEGVVEASLPGEQKAAKVIEKKAEEKKAVTAATTTKAAAEVQKEVANDIGKKVGQKKEAGQGTAERKEEKHPSKKIQDEKPKAEVPAGGTQA